MADPSGSKNAAAIASRRSLANSRLSLKRTAITNKPKKEIVMSKRHLTRAERRKARQRKNMMAIGAMALIAVIIVIIVILILKPHGDAPAAPVIEATDTPAPVVAATAIPTATATATPEPTEAPTDTPEPAPTFAPGEIPDVVSFYQPKTKSYSPRVKMSDEFSAKWKKGEDIGSFEVIASDAEELPGDFFGDIFGTAWKAFPQADKCKIGFTLRYTLKDGGEVKYTMLSPSHIQHTEYIECWLYDDYHRKPHKFYSHLKSSSMRPGTLITSIKLTAGKQIAHVTDIWLSAFVCASLDDFDAERNYIGDTSVTIHILKK